MLRAVVGSGALVSWVCCWGGGNRVLLALVWVTHTWFRLGGYVSISRPRNQTLTSVSCRFSSKFAWPLMPQQHRQPHTYERVRAIIRQFIRSVL
ncbi:hypothetical protein BDV95DRAFT_579837 [Massariosphaeria phaeospora]|uniref:Uncharacterized protein n=1 Tax=Massariosphaeria phaeospora TaxID=100035 RepID=A0A7C8I1L7_9PLEO|nr:hypothetical protein BDV95DRAFT_579837 [Massariosphaeria phaeospora]